MHLLQGHRHAVRAVAYAPWEPLMLASAGDAPEERAVLDRLYVRTLGRSPRRDEVGPSLDLVHAALWDPAATRSAVDDKARARAWSILSHALFCSTSFQYLD